MRLYILFFKHFHFLHPFFHNTSTKSAQLEFVKELHEIPDTQFSQMIIYFYNEFIDGRLSDDFRQFEYILADVVS